MAFCEKKSKNGLYKVYRANCVPNRINYNVTTSNVTPPNVTAPSITIPSITTPNITTPRITAQNVVVPSTTIPNRFPSSVTIPSKTSSSVTIPYRTTSNITTSNNYVPPQEPKPIFGKDIRTSKVSPVVVNPLYSNRINRKTCSSIGIQNYAQTSPKKFITVSPTVVNPHIIRKGRSVSRTTNQSQV